MILKIIKFSLLAVVVLVGVFIWGIVDWHSPKHTIGIYPLIDASQQKEGQSDFILPSDDYEIVASREDCHSEEKLKIYYELAIPQEGIMVQKEKEVDLSLVNHCLIEGFRIREHKTKGTLRIKVLTPSKSKVSIGLMTNHFAGM